MISARSSPQPLRKVAPLTVDVHPKTKPGYANTIPRLADASPFSPSLHLSATSGHSGVSMSYESQASSPVTSIPVSPLTPMIVTPRTSSFATKHLDGCSEPLEDRQPSQELHRQSQLMTAEERAVRPVASFELTTGSAPVTEYPRVCKMLEKHPAVKVDWKVPEPIKAAGETLRGFLIITAKELSSELKTAAAEAAAGVVGRGHHGALKKIKGKDKHRISPALAESNGMLSPDRAKSRSGKRSKSNRESSMVNVEHIEIELAGIEEVTTGNGLLLRTKSDHHCFLQKTQSLSVGEMRWIQDSSSASTSSTSTSPTMSSTSSSISSSYSSSSSASSGSASTSTSSSSSSQPYSITSTAPTTLSMSRKNTLSSFPNNLSNDNKLSEHQPMPLFEPGHVLPGTRQGIPFAMRVPEKVGGSFKSAHASINYQLTALVHIRLGREVFILKQSLPVSLFELVQVRASKVTSPHDVAPLSATPSSASAAGTITSQSAMSPSKAGVRFVIPQSNSVLGTASVRPYSLWGLGPATSSQSSQYQYSSSHGYGRYHHRRRGSLSSSTGSGGQYYHQRQGMTRSISATSGAMAAISQGPPTAQQQLLSAMGDPTDARTARSIVQGDRIDSLALPEYHSSSKRSSRREDEKGEQLDEVGFGAHIDKSVAAAGESVTMDMFVCKSELMKVVNIKVSLVETIQIYSLVNDEKDQPDLHERSPAVLPSDSKQQSRQIRRKRLVDTHVVKVAKAYVPAQAEESHANDNHLKGYYEDYEDFRTTKSLSMYKLSMRLPETALTITDRELVKVEYTFIIKFFFKGRMGAFLELPIEIVSQYNHNRISTISGAISCVSNSVQIALPPVPILVKRTDATLQSESVVSPMTATPEDQKVAKEVNNGSPQSPVQTKGVARVSDIDQEPEQAIPLKSVSALVETVDHAAMTGDISPTSPAGAGGDILRVLVSTEHLTSMGPSLLQSAEMPHPGNDTVLATAKVQASEFSDQTNDSPSTDAEGLPEAGEGKVSVPSPVTELAAKVVVLQRDSGPELPRIVIDGTKSTSFLDASKPDQKDLSTVALSSDESLSHEADRATIQAEVSPGEVTVMASPALPLLFDLTSAAAPIDSPQPIHNNSTKDGDLSGLSVPHHHHGPANAAGSSSNHNGGGLVAKIAKSISSSPLLRSSWSTSMGSSSSPNGSNSNLNLAGGSGSGSSSSPQNPQSTTFTLAVTTLSALTLLSSVSQAAVVGNGGDHGDDKNQTRGINGSNGHLANGNSNGGGGRTVAKLHRKGMDKLSAQQNQQQKRLLSESSRRNNAPMGPLKSCLKKSPTSKTRQQRPLMPDGTPSSQRKKVTFAKGSTPSPSPTGSMIFIEPHQPCQQHQHQQYQQQQRSLVYQNQCTITGPQPVRVTPHPIQAVPAKAMIQAPVYMVESPIKSPVGSFSLRSRGVHHPFDSHPCRLSPQEKQTLENRDHQNLLHTHQVKDTTVNIGVAHHESSEEDNQEEEEEEEEDGDYEDDDERDGDHDEEDDEDDERESEEERVERRRVARVAWLAKYGDAFKQVYGAVPELPPI
ncbi:hypothetical protein EMPS_04342 [Entomortierella parvispora]|uniref:Uncharacterized protein n=1 Tax=Entomortierella parvispora TaxID=205924 RepID=A0A9P3H8D6_9FUNG|nr:hypothetical protein EMPS_04342 [Entomortierella parvispora]